MVSVGATFWIYHESIESFGQAMGPSLAEAGVIMPYLRAKIFTKRLNEARSRILSGVKPEDMKPHDLCMLPPQYGRDWSELPLTLPSHPVVLST